MRSVSFEGQFIVRSVEGEGLHHIATSIQELTMKLKYWKYKISDNK